MSLSLAIAIVALADLAVIAGLAFVMTRARLLTPHGPAAAAAPGRTQPAVLQPGSVTVSAAPVPAGA